MYSGRIILNNYSKGSYGHILKDGQLNVYKITKISENGLLTASNINESIILNFLKIIKKICSSECNEQTKQKESVEQNEITVSDQPIDIGEIKLDNLANERYNPENLISVDKENFKTCINEKIFMQSISTNYYNRDKMTKTFMFADTSITNKYFDYFALGIDKFLLFNKMPNYRFNLAKFINKHHAYTIDNFDSIAKKILKSLALLHHNGFLHGDLKSPNILITDSYNVSLTDFGAVKNLYFDKYHLSCTISSRCPEDLEHEYDKNNYYSNSNASSDIWSLGLIFTEMILGFNPILKLYQQMEKTTTGSRALEKEILAHYQSLDYIDVLELVKINPIKNLLSAKNYEQISVIEQMLKINPEKRLSNIEQVYEKLFGEKFNFNYKVDYEYNYEKFNSGNNFITMYNLRKEHYKCIIDACQQLNILYTCPLIFDILDRLFIKILDKSINNVIDLRTPESNLLFASVILIASGIMNQSQPSYSDLLMSFKLKNDLVNVASINNNLLEILKLMEFDICRPFNIFFCYHLTENKKCKCTCTSSLINKENSFVIHCDKQKNNLISILNNIIDGSVIGVCPEYYYKKLLLDEL
jgi:serine/threonine protein kinase